MSQIATSWTSFTSQGLWLIGNACNTFHGSAEIFYKLGNESEATSSKWAGLMAVLDPIKAGISEDAVSLMQRMKEIPPKNNGRVTC